MNDQIWQYLIAAVEKDVHKFPGLYSKPLGGSLGSVKKPLGVQNVDMPTSLAKKGGDEGGQFP